MREALQLENAVRVPLDGGVGPGVAEPPEPFLIEGFEGPVDEHDDAPQRESKGDAKNREVRVCGGADFLFMRVS